MTFEISENEMKEYLILKLCNAKIPCNRWGTLEILGHYVSAGHNDSDFHLSKNKLDKLNIDEIMMLCDAIIK